MHARARARARNRFYMQNTKNMNTKIETMCPQVKSPKLWQHSPAGVPL